MRIMLICVGSELLRGRVNTHTAVVADALSSNGLELSAEITIPDDRGIIAKTINHALSRNDLVIVSGGLGPTDDDITREAAALALNRPLRRNQRLRGLLHKKIKERGYSPTQGFDRQADCIDQSILLANHVGSAPGMLVSKGKRRLFLLPGPRDEFEPMVKEHVVPYLQNNAASHRWKKTVHIFGIPEMRVDAMIRPIRKNLAKLKDIQSTYSIIADRSLVSVSLILTGPKAAKLDQYGAAALKRMHRIFKKTIVSEDMDGILHVVHRALLNGRCSIAVAESCTGGLLCAQLTSLPDSSVFFRQGLIVYSNQGKINMLGIQPRVIGKHGAVSYQTARMMAVNMRRMTGTDYAVSITGIAGPGGGSANKPVGLVFIGIADRRHVTVEKFLFRGDRTRIRDQAVFSALSMIRAMVTGISIPGQKTCTTQCMGGTYENLYCCSSN
ncbi:MAG: CinA family nicotinamide mononucleotide deamidase-related protein [Elusimicrobia bacterium]|nr:CinA family nicotinamide mononucleotide deamidase-related protein [Elusimicrobiota bacterium]MBD3412022.1 CinA family nicotinamide mononucleotide deamidase-related protein [Elusimicrobiota bacterium]